VRAGDELGERRFRLIDELGRGAHGVVWKAFDRRRDVFVAVKVLHPDIASDMARREQFFRAARLMSELQHPSVVRVIEPRGEDGGFHYFVMEWVPGGDLRRAVLEKKLTHAAVLSLIITVGEALAHLNSRGIVHRAIKPSNILLSDSSQPVLTDFGLLLSADEEEEPKSEPLGAYLYAAEECLAPPRDADARADVYGLGMTAIFGLYGSELPPYVIFDTDDILRDSACSPALAHVLWRATRRRRDERYQDVGALREALIQVREAPFERRSALGRDVQELVSGIARSPDSVITQGDALEALAANHGVAVIIADRSGAELFKTREANGLLSRWFTGHEPDSRGLPPSLLEFLQLLSRRFGPVIPPFTNVYDHTGSASRLTVRMLPIYGEQGFRWWTLALQEVDRPPLPLVPPAWQEKLTLREAQVLECVLQGWDHSLISEHLGCQRSTVKKHLQRVFDKLGIDSRRSLVSLASLYQR
jgi:serine/threonine protein kinase/DNA-binding CsgD family transcriptional regulator